MCYVDAYSKATALQLISDTTQKSSLKPPRKETGVAS